MAKLLKRKGYADQVNDDFPLASPATKIRRLDAELPPIVEEEEPLPLPSPSPSPSPSPNEERALVLFKPLHHSPSSFSLTLHPHLISGIRNNQFLWSKKWDHVTGSESHEKDNDELALVPWVPSPSYQFSNDEESDAVNAELMEADEMEEGEGGASMMMDIEQESEGKSSTSTIQYPGMAEGFQQHCLLPQLPHNTSTPITWTR